VLLKESFIGKILGDVGIGNYLNSIATEIRASLEKQQNNK
jgi:hypothetical protein